MGRGRSRDDRLAHRHLARDPISRKRGGPKAPVPNRRSMQQRSRFLVLVETRVPDSYDTARTSAKVEPTNRDMGAQATY